MATLRRANGARGPFRHYVAADALVSAAPEHVFARLDDQTRLAAHMQQPSAMMGGGRMTYDFDAGRGQVVGSHIKMGGSAFGLSLFVDEVLTERDPPRRKVWRTVGAPRLIIIGAYEMGFSCEGDGAGTRLQVWISYDLPRSFLGGLAGILFAGWYARWCVQRMSSDAVRCFAAGLD